MPETEVQIKEKIRAFFSKFVGDMELSDDDELFSSGLVNSLFAMQLLLYIEKEFAIAVSNEDLDIKNFNTISAVTDFVLSKTN